LSCPTNTADAVKVSLIAVCELTIHPSSHTRCSTLLKAPTLHDPEPQRSPSAVPGQLRPRREWAAAGDLRAKRSLAALLSVESAHAHGNQRRTQEDCPRQRRYAGHDNDRPDECQPRIADGNLKIRVDGLRWTNDVFLTICSIFALVSVIVAAEALQPGGFRASGGRNGYCLSGCLLTRCGRLLFAQACFARRRLYLEGPLLPPPGEKF
jgi:hypothetical protein